MPRQWRPVMMRVKWLLPAGGAHDPSRLHRRNTMGPCPARRCPYRQSFDLKMNFTSGAKPALLESRFYRSGMGRILKLLRFSRVTRASAVAGTMMLRCGARWWRGAAMTAGCAAVNFSVTVLSPQNFFWYRSGVNVSPNSSKDAHPTAGGTATTRRALAPRQPTRTRQTGATRASARTTTRCRKSKYAGCRAIFFNSLRRARATSARRGPSRDGRRRSLAIHTTKTFSGVVS